ncbi:hypothetical protein LguiB_018467 [Lonicera macranthoides]
MGKILPVDLYGKLAYRFDICKFGKNLAADRYTVLAYRSGMTEHRSLCRHHQTSIEVDLNSELGCVFSCNAAAMYFHTLLLSGCFGNALGCVVTHLASTVMHWAKDKDKLTRGSHTLMLLCCEIRTPKPTISDGLIFRLPMGHAHHNAWTLASSSSLLSMNSLSNLFSELIHFWVIVATDPLWTPLPHLGFTCGPMEPGIHL